MSLDLAEAHRIAVAWGPTSQPVTLADLWSHGEHGDDCCRWTRKDGFVCWREATGDDVCPRHELALEEYLEAELTGLAAVRTAVAAMNGTPRSPDRGVYFVAAGDLVKIGKTHTIRQRVMSLQCGSPLPVQLVRFISVSAMGTLEQWLHRRYAEHRRHGEWFDSEPVLADIATQSDDWLRLESSAAFPLTGTPQAIARFFGTPEGRHASTHLDLCVRFPV